MQTARMECSGVKGRLYKVRQSFVCESPIAGTFITDEANCVELDISNRIVLEKAD